MGGFANWGAVLFFFPLWTIMAFVWFSVAARLKKGQRPQTVRLLDNSALILSLGCAAAVLLNLDCQSVISIGFLDPVCQSHDLKFAALMGM